MSTMASAVATASVKEALPFARLKASVAANVTLTRSRDVSVKRSQPRSLRTSPESSALAALRSRDDLLRARHLRNAVVADEAHRLDAREAGRREPPHEVRANSRRKRFRLVLEPVARADVTEG